MADRLYLPRMTIQRRLLVSLNPCGSCICDGTKAVVRPFRAESSPM